MGCINTKSGQKKLDRQSAYMTIQKPIHIVQQEISTERFQNVSESQQQFLGIDSQNIFIKQKGSSYFGQAIQILNINKDKQLKQKIETLRQHQKRITQFSPSFYKELDEIMVHIQSKTITLDILFKKNEQLQMLPFDILYVPNNEGKSVIELILNQIDNYDIITQLILKQGLSEDHLQIIAIPLFRKLKYLHSHINVERGLEFLKATSKTKFIEIILQTSLQKGNNNIIQNFSNIFTYIDQQNEIHLKFFKILSLLVQQVKPFEKKFDEYREASAAFKLKYLIISKKIKKGHLQDELKMHSTLSEIQFNIFHQVTLNKKWDIFVQYSNNLIQSPNNSQITPFMMFFQNAPFMTILNYIKQFPQQFIKGIEYSTNQGLNLLHCFCFNNNLSIQIDNSCQEIMNLFLNYKNFKQLLQQPYQDQIPLVFYINRQKIVDQQFLDFLGQNLLKQFDFYKLDTLAQILGEQMKFRKIRQKKSIKYLKTMKQQPFKQGVYELNIELSQELQQQYDLYYLHYIQLMKIVIKRNLLKKYSHLNQFLTFTSYFPYELGTSHHSFLQIVLSEQNDELILEQLKKFNFNNYLQNQIKELDKFNVQLPADYSMDAQLLAKLIYLKQDIKDQQSQVNKEINQIILNQFKRDPKLIWQKIYGNSKLKYEGCNTTLYQLIKQLLDVVFIKDVLDITIYNNLQNPSINVMKEFVFQELLYKKLTLKEPELRNFCDSFPRSIEFNETKKYQIKIYTWNLGQQQSDNILEIAQFYLIIQNVNLKYMKKLISNSQVQLTITFNFLQALLESEITLNIICQIINLNPNYFIPKIFWLTQNRSLNKPLLKFIQTKKINPIMITQPNINQLELLFDWQMIGVQFKIVRFSKKKYIYYDLLPKSQLISYQMINNLPFVIVLAIDDYFNEDLCKFLQTSQVQTTKEIISQIQLHLMLQNSAKKNIQLLIDQFNLDFYIIFEILSGNYFANSKLFLEYTLFEMQEVNKFNFNRQLQQLLQYNFNYYSGKDTIEREIFSYFFTPIINQLNYESLIMLGLNLRNQLYQRYIYEIKFNQINDERIIEMIIDEYIKVQRKSEENNQISYLGPFELLKAIRNNKNCAEMFCRHLTKEELQNTSEQFANMLYQLSLISNQICLKYLDKLSIKNYQFLQVYYYALSDQNIELLNHLIYYYNQKQMSVTYVYNYKHLDKNVKNYYNALYQKYYLVFTVQEYELLYNTVEISSQAISEHIQMFILLGYVEQLKFLIQQQNIQIEIQNYYFHYVFTKKMCIENELGMEVNTFPEFLKNKQVLLQLFLLKIFKRTYQQFCIFSFSKQKCTFNFYQSKIDYLEAFQILNQIMSNAKQKILNQPNTKEKTEILKMIEELDDYNELYNVIIYPQAKQIQLKAELVAFFCILFIRTKTLNTFLANNYDNYISLLNANLKNVEIIFDFRKPKQFSLKFILEILIEYIRQILQKQNINLDIYQKLTKYIFQYQFENLNLAECINLGLQNYNLTYFNKTTLFYAQNKINLLPKDYYDYSQNKHYRNRYQFIKTIMNIDEISLDKMTPIQVLLSKGKLDHIDQINYSNSNLMAALISNNINTIYRILDLSQNPKQICSQFQLFHIILKFQNENNIITFFHKYIEYSIKDINELMLFQNDSILLQIVFKRQQQVFDCIVVQYLQRLTNKQNHIEIVQQHLKMKVKSLDIKIYQLGIQQKSYFIFDFLDGIIQPNEIDQLVTKLDLNLNQKLLNYQKGNSKINLFANYYLNSLQIVLIPTQRQQLRQQTFKKRTKNVVYKEVQKRHGITRKKKTFIIGVWSQDNNAAQRVAQLDNLIDIEHACIYKLFGFYQCVLKYMKNNFNFFLLFQSQPQDILIAIDICKGNQKLLENYLNSLIAIDICQGNLDEIVRKCQQFYLIQNPIFYKLIITFAEDFLRLLKPSDYNLEVCLLISFKLKQTQILQNFIDQQLQLLQQAAQQNIDGIDTMQQNHLFMMSLFLNNYQLPILKTGFQHITIEILIKSLKFIEQNFEKQQTNISNLGLKYILSLLNENIVISNKNKFQQLINSQFTGQAIILGMIWIQQIETIVKFFFSKLPKWGIFGQKVEITFYDIPIQFNKEQYIIPLQYQNDRFELNEILINEFIPVLKQLKFQYVMERESDRFQEFEQEWPQYNFKLLFKKINITQIPSYCFEHLDDVIKKKSIKKQKTLIQQQKNTEKEKQIKKQKEPKKEQEPEEPEQQQESKKFKVVMKCRRTKKQQEPAQMQTGKQKEPEKQKQTEKQQEPKEPEKLREPEKQKEPEKQMQTEKQQEPKEPEKLQEPEKQKEPEKQMQTEKQQEPKEPEKLQEPEKQKEPEKQIQTEKQQEPEKLNGTKINYQRKSKKTKIKKGQVQDQEYFCFYENMIFFKKLLPPFKENSQNYNINDFQAPHKFQEDFGVQKQKQSLNQQDSGKNSVVRKQFQQKVEIIKSWLPKNKFRSRSQHDLNKVFIEFYHFIYPQITDIFLQQLSSQEYIKQFTPKATLEYFIYKFKQYYDNIYELIKTEKYNKWTITIPYYIENDQFIYQEIQFTPYAIQYVFQKFSNFINAVRSFSDFEIDIIQWRVNTISVLEVLVNTILNCYFLDKQSIDIFAIIDSICQWKLLQLILAQIIYRNIMSLSKVSNLFSRIYVEFREKNTREEETKNYSNYFLDKIFQFEQTEYHIQNKTLIITLNVYIRKDNNQYEISEYKNQLKRSQINKSNIFQTEEMSFHLLNIINDCDFLFDSFQPGDLVEFLFNRLEIDQYIQKFSNSLSKFVNKDVAIIVNHQQLKNLYEDEIIQIKQLKDRKLQILRQNQIKNDIISLKEFFLAKVYDSFFEQLKSQSFEQLFLVQVSILLQSIRQNNQLYLSTQQNYRKAIKSAKSKVVEKISKFSNNKILSYQFGFQLTPTYFQQIVKLGDICMIMFQQDGQLKVEPCQLIQNQDSVIFTFYLLKYKIKPLTLDQIDGKLRLDKQKTAKVEKSKQKKDNEGQQNDVLNMLFEDIITVVWFRSKWPIEQNFNNEILNLIFIDQNGNMLTCHEKKFVQKIIMIQQMENEYQKQLLLDNLFGQNIVNTTDKFALTQIIPIIPSQINYNFKFKSQVQQQNIQLNNNDIYITISSNSTQINETIDKQKQQLINVMENNEDNYFLDKLSIGNFNTACYFDSNQKIQKLIKKLNKFTHKIKEMSKMIIKISFDDYLNKNPSFYLEQFFAHNNVFQEFQQGFKEFCEQKEFPQIDNTLSNLFDCPSLTYVKERKICQIIKQTEFHFELGQLQDEKDQRKEEIVNLQQEIDQLIQFENRTLKIYMFIYGKKPLKSHISYFFSNLIAKYEKHNISPLIINDQLYDIEIEYNDDPLLSNSLANTILLTTYLYKLIEIKQNEKSQKKIKFLLQQQSSTQFYRFSQQGRQITLFYNQLKDFSLDIFLLDYLNECKYQGQIKYESLIVDDLIFNSQIIKNYVNIKDNQYYPEIKKEDKNLFISKDFSKLQLMEGRLDPKEQERIFLIFYCKGIYQNMITYKSQQKYIPLYQYIKQIRNQQYFGQSFYFLVCGLNQRIDLDNQLNTIQVSMNINNKKTKRSLNYYKRHNSKLNVKARLITTSIALVELIGQGIKSVKFRSTVPQLLMNSLNNENYQNSITIQFYPDQTNTQNQNKQLEHIGILIENENKDQIYKPINFSQKQSSNQLNENRKMIQFLLKGIDFKPQVFKKNNLNITRVDLTELLKNNIITTLNQNQIGVASFCGQTRTDFMEILDLTGSQIQTDNTLFVHSQYQQIQVQPQVFKESLGFKLKWQPIIKGIYNLFLGEQKIDGHFIVLADQIDYRRCKITTPDKINTLTLYQTLKIVIVLRDHFNNIYGDIESKLNPIQPNIIINSQFSDYIIEQIGPNKEGNLTINIKFTQKEDLEHQAEDVKIKVSLQNKLEEEYTFHLEGLTLEMRIVKYYSKITIPIVFKELKINRFKFGSDILDQVDQQFKCPLKIKFIGEQGSDDGGLRREFYNKFGEMLKGPSNGYFQQNKQSQTYFYSKQFMTNYIKEKYALIFGKLIANSILNKEIIGVPFAHQFWKLIFNIPIIFEDLDGIMDENEFQNYKSLRQMKKEDFEMLGVNFTITKSKETIQLIPNGDNTFVSIDNIDLYLQRIAEYYIVEQFLPITKKMNEGFESVLNKQILIECFDVTEMHTLTVGSTEIKPEKVLELVKYINGSDQLIQFFQKFINQMEEKPLQNFLQFTTGSPYLPWNAKPTIQIEFQDTMKETDLPRSQTCFYKLIIPYYKTYEDLKKKLDIAIIYGQEGFGQF